MQEYEDIFKAIDTNGDGAIERVELKKTLHQLGYEDISDGDVEKMIKEVDLNKNEVVEFSEFLRVI